MRAVNAELETGQQGQQGDQTTGLNLNGNAVDLRGIPQGTLSSLFPGHHTPVRHNPMRSAGLQGIDPFCFLNPESSSRLGLLPYRRTVGFSLPFSRLGVTQLAALRPSLRPLSASLRLLKPQTSRGVRCLERLEASKREIITVLRHQTEWYR